MNIGNVRIFQNDWDEAAKEFEQAIEIADDIGCGPVSMEGRERSPSVNVNRNSLSAAEEIVKATRNYEVPSAEPPRRGAVRAGLVASGKCYRCHRGVYRGHRRGRPTDRPDTGTVRSARRERAIAVWWPCVATKPRFRPPSPLKGGACVDDDPGVVHMVPVFRRAGGGGHARHPAQLVRSAAAGEQRAYERRPHSAWCTPPVRRPHKAPPPKVDQLVRAAAHAL